MRSQSTLDVSDLPVEAFGSRGLIWWGTLGFVAIEGSVILLGFISYFYIRTRVSTWPPGNDHPDLLIPTINTLVILASALPMYFVDRAAKRLDRRAVIIWSLVCIAFGIAFSVLRVFEYSALNTSWDSNAYGSVVWTILSFHTFHIVAEVVETIFITTIIFTGHTKKKYFVDASDNAVYWYFIVLIWVPSYVILYLAPYFL